MFKNIVKITKWTISLHIFLILINYSFFHNLLENLSENFDYSAIDDDLNYDIEFLVNKYGYNFENHPVITEDGYILQLHRISSPNNKNSSNKSNKSNKLNKSKPKQKIVFIQHGIFVSSIVWLLEGPNRALAYKLADEGFDVWLGNTRGNAYSRKHLTTDVKQQPEVYYNYSFHEIGVFDISASIDYILNTTKLDKVNYIGHSQGCVAFFVLLSERKEYVEKIDRMIAMAPGVFTNDAWTLNVVLGRKFYGFLEWYWNKIQMYDIFSHNNFGGKYQTALLCADGSFIQVICRFSFYLIGGYNPQQLNTTLLPMFFTHAPVGASIKQVLHYLQLSRAGEFQHFDYGPMQNSIKYGQNKPLRYDLSHISTEIYIFYSENDFYSSEQMILIDINLNLFKDTLKLAKMLKNVQRIEKITDKHFTHLNFMVSTNIYEVLNQKVVKMLLN